MNNGYLYIGELEEEIKKVSQTQLAQVVGVSPASLSKYINRDYEGNIININNKIKAYLKRKNERANHWDKIIVDTEVLSTMLKTIRLAHVMRKMGIIYGPAGIGKTIAAQKYALENPGTILATAAPDSKSVKGLVSTLHYELFKKPLNGGSMSGRISIVEKLGGSDRLIILDQAHDLSNDALEEVRAIYDATGNPFVLIGTDEIFSRLTNRRAHRILEQMNSRIPIKRSFKLMPLKQDLKKVCRAYGIEDKDIIKRMSEKGFRGGLRLVTDQINIARFIANGQEVTMKHIVDAESMSGDVNVYAE